MDNNLIYLSTRFKSLLAIWASSIWPQNVGPVLCIRGLLLSWSISTSCIKKIILFVLFNLWLHAVVERRDLRIWLLFHFFGERRCSVKNLHFSQKSMKNLFGHKLCGHKFDKTAHKTGDPNKGSLISHKVNLK